MTDEEVFKVVLAELEPDCTELETVKVFPTQPTVEITLNNGISYRELQRLSKRFGTEEILIIRSNDKRTTLVELFDCTQVVTATPIKKFQGEFGDLA